MPGSSAPKGSSSSSIFGRVISACARARRCCMPPESCAGYLSSMPRRGHLGEQRRRLCLAPRLAPKRRARSASPRIPSDDHVAEHRQMREHRVALEHDAAVGSARRQRLAVDEDASARRRLLAEQHAQERRLAAARGSDKGDEGVRRDLERSSRARPGRHIPSRRLSKMIASSRALLANQGKPAPQPRSAKSVRKASKRDPGDVGQDHVHREIAAHQEDAVAEAALRGDRLRGDEEQPRRPERSRTESMRRGSICGSTTRSTICHVDAPSVCALTICSAGSSPTRNARSRMRARCRSRSARSSRFRRARTR